MYTQCRGLQTQARVPTSAQRRVMTGTLGSETQPYISEKITAVITIGTSWYMSRSERFLCFVCPSNNQRRVFCKLVKWLSERPLGICPFYRFLKGCLKIISIFAGFSFSDRSCLRKERGKEGGVTASRAYQRRRGWGGVVGEPIRGVRGISP